MIEIDLIKWLIEDFMKEEIKECKRKNTQNIYKSEMGLIEKNCRYLF